ncbi:hypothetical protein LQZ21_01545 [Treponema sp. TIM-1]|uniref:hypothetical protein n=1 Tax=Treponema sp. TIM-1 TaxID=2898417 RepID=UPI00397EDF02
MGDSIKYSVIGIIVFYIIVFIAGHQKGMKENYETDMAIAAESYKVEINELQKNIKSTRENYDNEILTLQKRQSVEINTLERKLFTEIVSLQEERSAEIDYLEIKQDTEIVSLQQSIVTNIDKLKEQNKEELIQIQNAYYIQGQKDSRDVMQREIDSKARKNMSKGDWNAPVYSIVR